jgi:hypothetical protein
MMAYAGNNMLDENAVGADPRARKRRRLLRAASLGGVIWFYGVKL